MEEMGAFYDAMMPRMEEIIAYLDGVPDGDERPEPAPPPLPAVTVAG